MNIHKDDAEATFEISTIGDKDNKQYMGKFRVKCLLSPIEEIEANNLYRELLNNTPHLASERARQLAFALAELEYRVVECDPFWENKRLNGSHIKNTNVIHEVLDLAIEAQQKYLDMMKDDLIESQEKMTALIKNKKIEREPEMDAIGDKVAAELIEGEEVEIEE